ncbi:MAG: hypothetical protein WCT03_27660 [Candidatus Obscuribacterales bacterium]
MSLTFLFAVGVNSGNWKKGDVLPPSYWVCGSAASMSPKESISESKSSTDDCLDTKDQSGDSGGKNGTGDNGDRDVKIRSVRVLAIDKPVNQCHCRNGTTDEGIADDEPVLVICMTYLEQ